MPTGASGSTFSGVARDDIAVGARIEHRFALLRFRQRIEQRARLVLLGRRARAVLPAVRLRNIRRIGAEEARRVDGHVIAGEREIE